MIAASRQSAYDLVYAVSHALRTRRLERGLSLRQVAALTGCQLANVSMIELGQREAKIGTLAALAKALGTTPSKVLLEAERVLASWRGVSG